MANKSDIRSVLHMLLFHLSTGIAIGLIVFALTGRHLDARSGFKWLGPSVVYADGGRGGGDHEGGGGGDHEGGGGGDHEGGGGGGDHESGGGRDNADHGREGLGKGDVDHDHGTDIGDHEKGNNPADRSAEPDARNDSDQAEKQLSGLEGIRNLTPVTKEEEAGLVGNWGSPVRNNPPGSKP